ncbi:uncharacterized protein [Panulirus ornatus]|uniref:uncharacterized protein n=1 Tax=Panulirus ornatus TaxID=150431 RepID=UPI003A85F69D
MAEMCVETSLENTEVRSPQSPTFSSFRDQGNTPKLKSFIISRVNMEETPRSTVICKPMPPLMPMDHGNKGDPEDCPSPLARLHPKKRPRQETGCELDHQSFLKLRDFPDLPPVSPVLSGKFEGLDDFQSKTRPTASRPEKDSHLQISDPLYPYRLSPTLILRSTPSDLTASSPSSFSVDSPQTLSAFSRMPHSFVSLEDEPLVGSMTFSGRKRSRSPDGDTSLCESSETLRTPAKRCRDGAALDLSWSAQMIPVSDSRTPSYLEARGHPRSPLSYGQSQGLLSVASPSQGDAYDLYQLQGLLQTTLTHGGLLPSAGQTRSVAAPGYLPGHMGSATYPSGHQGSVIQPTPQHAGGVTHHPGQHSLGVTHHSGQSRGVTQLPGQSRGVTHHPGQSRGVAHHPGQSRGVAHHPGQSRAVVTHHPGQSRGVAHHPGQSRGVAHHPGQSRGMTQLPGQSRGVTRGQARGVAHTPSDGRGVARVLGHTPDQSRDLTYLGQTMVGERESAKPTEMGSQPLLNHLLKESSQTRPVCRVGSYHVDYDRLVEGGRYAGCALTSTVNSRLKPLLGSPLAGGSCEAGNKGHPFQLRTLLRPQNTTSPPLLTLGNQSRRMPSEVPYRFPFYDDVSKSSRTPSASSKNLEWVRPTSEEEKFGSIPIAEWTSSEVVDFLFNACHQLNFEYEDMKLVKLSGLKGSDLLKLDENGFKQLYKNYGDKVYRYFQEYKAKERRQFHGVELHPQCFANNHIYSSVFDNGDKSTLQPPLVPKDPLVTCETAAPYEVRYETLKDYRGLHCFEDGGKNLMSLNKLPTAALKSYAPLNAMSPPSLPNGILENISDPEQSTSEEEPRPEPPKKRGPGRPRKPENELKKKKKKTGRLWEFIRNLLLDPETCPSLVRWEDPEQGTFRFMQAEKVAQKWGDRKQNKDMNYEKLSRAMRYYYKTHIFEAVIGKRLVYKFGKNAKDWRPSNPNFPDLQTR